MLSKPGVVSRSMILSQPLLCPDLATPRQDTAKQGINTSTTSRGSIPSEPTTVDFIPNNLRGLLGLTPLIAPRTLATVVDSLLSMIQIHLVLPVHLRFLRRVRLRRKVQTTGMPSSWPFLSCLLQNVPRLFSPVCPF